MLVFCALPVFAERPKIGLALSGGGAKGSAHIAVLEVLEANQIAVDYISGTSIGAYIGGLYALGHSAAEIKQIMYAIDLDRGYSDSIDREKLPYRVKNQKDKFNVPLEIGFRDYRLQFPSGLLYGQTMSEIYLSSAGVIDQLNSFDELAIPFRAIATDLSTSEIVVLGSGNLLKSMQASATVPGALVPVEIDGSYLVDGGLSANIPIAQVKEMGADIVIAVDISAPLLNKRDLNKTLPILRQVSNFLTLKNIEEQKQLLTKSDVYIRPNVSQLSAIDFSDLEEAYQQGRIATEAKLDHLRELSIETGEYQQYRNSKTNYLTRLQKKGERPITEIVLQNNSNVSDEFLLDTLGLSAATAINSQQLVDAIDRLYSLNRFERVEANFEQRRQGRVLLIKASGKSWGPNFIEMGLAWEDDFTLDSIVNLDFSYTMGDITANDGEWRNELGIGTNKSLISELHLPLGEAQSYYSSILYEFHRDSRDFFVNNQRAILFELVSNRLDLSLGYKFQVAGTVEFGMTVETGTISNELQSQVDLEYDAAGIFFRVGYDTLDRLTFPTRGKRITFEVYHREEDVRGDLITSAASTNEPYFSTQYLLDWKGAISNGNHGLIGRTSFAHLSSESDQSIYFEQLGGFLNLSGYHKNALLGNNKVFGSLSYQYDLGRGVFGLNDFPLYVGASVEAGNVWLTSETMKLSESIAAGSFYIGTNTALGPVAIGVGFAEGNQNSIYFYLGKNI